MHSIRLPKLRAYQQANDVVFAVEVDGLPEDTVVNYTINYEFYNVLMHQNMVVPDSIAGADTTNTAPGMLYSTNYSYTGYLHDAWDSETSTKYSYQKTTELQ